MGFAVVGIEVGLLLSLAWAWMKDDDGKYKRVILVLLLWGFLIYSGVNVYAWFYEPTRSTVAQIARDEANELNNGLTRIVSCNVRTVHRSPALLMIAEGTWESPLYYFAFRCECCLSSTILAAVGPTDRMAP